VEPSPLSKLNTLRRLYLDQMIRHAHQHHAGNYSVDRFGSGGEWNIAVGNLRAWQELILDHMGDLAWLWERLADDRSREILLESMLFKSLGHLKVRRRCHTPEYNQALNGGPSCGGAAEVIAEAVRMAGRVPLHRYRLRALTIVPPMMVTKPASSRPCRA